jgi:asparagine synthase (glutamine-hydrolysing)
MAHGLETRVPFLDNDLVDFAQRLPVGLKLGNLEHVSRLDENDPEIVKYFQKSRDGKMLLRKAMGRHVPAEVTGREKQGFSAPDASWFKGESIEYVRKVIFENEARLYEYLDRDVVHRLVEEHLGGQKNRRLLIWSLLNIESWLQQYT